MKKCTKCETMINDSDSDYCEECAKQSNLIGEEKALIVFSNLIMVLGVISSIIMAFTITVIKQKQYFGEYLYSNETINITGVIITISTLISSILFSLLLKLFVKISANIREIANKIK